MEQLSITSLIIVSYPEAIVVAILGILSVGKFDYLKSRSNIIRILVHAFISTVIVYFTRQLAKNEIESLLLALLTLILLFTFVLKLKFYEAIIAAPLALTIFSVIEVGCIMVLLTVMRVPFESLLKSDLVRFFTFLPERAIEVALIFFSIRYKIKIIDMQGTDIRKKEYYIQLAVYIVSIATLIFLSLLMFRMLFYDHSSLRNSTNDLLLRINIYLSLFATVVLTLAIRNTTEFYKKMTTLNNNEYLQSLEYISSLMEEKNYNEAKGAVDSLKDHISKK